MFFKNSRKSIDNDSPTLKNGFFLGFPQVVVNCRVCDMINIGDKNRVLCPYCGSFYDPNLRLNSNENNKRNITHGPLKRCESLSTSESSSAKTTTSSNSREDSDSDDPEESQMAQSRGGVRNFLKNLISSSKKNSKSNPNLNKIQNTKLKSANSTQNFKNTELNNGLKREKSTPKIIQESVLHPFLSVKNKEDNFFLENKTKYKLDLVNFNSLYLKSLESGDFKELGDFYCWTFSKSSNLIDLLVTEKHSRRKESTDRINSANFQNKKYDASLFVSTNWKFMKELYSSLQKM
ncbi:unnamed protein product, partial [Brachionus calyciflorus]